MNLFVSYFSGVIFCTSENLELLLLGYSVYSWGFFQTVHKRKTCVFSYFLWLSNKIRKLFFRDSLYIEIVGNTQYLLIEDLNYWLHSHSLHSLRTDSARLTKIWNKHLCNIAQGERGYRKSPLYIFTLNNIVILIIL